MNKLIVIFLSVFLTVGSVAKSNGQTLSKKQTELIKNQVDSVFLEMVVLAEKLDFDKLSLGVDDTREAGFIANVDKSWKVVYSHQSTTR